MLPMLHKIALQPLNLDYPFLNANAVGKNLTFLLPAFVREVTQSHMKEKTKFLKLEEKLSSVFPLYLWLLSKS